MKFLIIGSGMIGETHTRVLQKLGHEIALCDTLSENLRLLGDHFQISERYLDAETALQCADADAVVICTPNHLHAPVAIQAMEHGYDVLCEKPMAATAEQAREMLKVAQRTGRCLMIGYIVRTYDAIDKVKETLDSGTLGRVVSARCVLATPETLNVARTKYRLRYETGGGIIYDYTHELDYCRLLFGEPAEVFAFCGSYLHAEDSVDDSADMLIRYKNSVVLSLHMDYIQRVGRAGCSRSFEIVCEKGTVACDFHSVQVNWNDGRSVETRFQLDWDAAFKKQAERFITLCNGGDAPHASGLDGLRALELADSLYYSSREGILVKMSSGEIQTVEGVS